MADNCTDATVRLAREAGVDVFETVDNDKKKAGGLNQAIARVLPGMGENDCVMVMDADTTLDPGFLEAAARRLSDDRALMAVGGLFYGEEGGGLIGLFQRNEYTRYQRDLKRRRGRVFVLTGTASVFRSRALRAVAEERGRNLPGIPGDVYDTVALTEDNELTIALKSLGALMISPPDCTVVTEVMPTWRALWAQRLRWQRGALENLGAYGLRPATFRYWAQQLGIGYGVIALAAYLGLIVLMVVATDTWVWFPFWIGVGLGLHPRAGGHRVARRLEGAAPGADPLPRALLRDVPQRRLREGGLGPVPGPAGRLEARGPAGPRTSGGELMHVWGILLPESTLREEFIAVLAAFVAINTILYVTLAVAKILPKVYVQDWINTRNRRSETRSIHPDAPV